MSKPTPKIRSTTKLLEDISKSCHEKRHIVKNNTVLIEEEEWGHEIFHLDLSFIHPIGEAS
jgi:hypothetical protein